jgi:hypothetical protein
MGRTVGSQITMVHYFNLGVPIRRERLILRLECKAKVHYVIALQWTALFIL